MRRPLRGSLLVMVAVWSVWTAAGTASAHTSLVAASPTGGESATAMPPTVVLTLTEPAVALGTAVVVTGPSGPVQQGDPELSGRTVTQPVRTDAAAGDYVVDWRVPGADGHPVVGRLTFTVSDGTGAARSPSGAASTPPGPAGSAANGAPPGWSLLVG